MFLKYPNNEFSHIFNSDIDKKLKILEQLASQNKVAKNTIMPLLVMHLTVYMLIIIPKAT